VIGLHKKWGFSHIHFSRFNAFVGAVEGARDSVTHQFINSEGAIVSPDKLKSRSLDLPFNNVVHTKITSVSNLIIHNCQLKINLGFQSNHRKEFGEDKKVPNVYFLLNTLTYDAKLLLPEKKGFEVALGASGMTQWNQNKGFEFVIPDYFLQDAGVFVYAKKSFNRFTINAGLRCDYRKITGNSLYLDSLGKPANTGDTIFEAFSKQFVSVSGAIGFTYTFNKNFNVKLNIGRGYRSPNIYELATSMNGAAPDPGTFSFNAGNYTLKPEASIQIDGEFTYNSKYIDASISGFYNHIGNYIYQRNINNEFKVFEGQSVPVYRFVQGNSLLTGFEAGLNIHPLKSLSFENTMAYVHGTNLSTKVPLPFIPATHSFHEIKWVFVKGRNNSVISNAYAKFGVKNVWEQNRFDSFETKTGAYTLIHAGIGCDIKIGKQKLSIFINGENLANKKYFDHLNRFKILDIYNPGRNINFGISLPFTIDYQKK
ncbi:MAG: TonB-dependent receptor, partial [Bacteroidota bacterium]